MHWALEHRSESKALRDALRSLQVDGFRDAGRAPVQRLLPAVLEAISGDDQDLARSVLDGWVDSHGPLRDRVAEHLEETKRVLVPEAPDARFVSFWTAEEWQSECSTLEAVIDGTVDRNSIELMLCLLAGRFPRPPRLRSQLFKDCLDSLQGLPPDAPEWKEVNAFVKWVQDIRYAKGHELMDWRREKIAGISRSLRERFGENLQYLGINPDTWPGLVEKRPALTEAAVELLESLTVSFEAYEPIRPQAPSRAEEIERSVKRGECEGRILATVTKWQERVDQPDPSDGDVSRRDAGGRDARADSKAADVVAEKETSSDKAGDSEDSGVRELEVLRHDKQCLEEDNRRLRQEVSRLQRRERDLRLAYVEEERRKATPEEPDGKPMAAEPVLSVREAIDRAQEMFPDRLHVKLNSRSEPDTPFGKPPGVFDALEWLATSYREGPSIAETCPGWFCKKHQSATTMGQYPDWYETDVDGVRWTLKSRLGKGKSHDPRHTIRIAFAWDESNDRAIVGFVGLHQQNRSS